MIFDYILDFYFIKFVVCLKDYTVNVVPKVASPSIEGQKT